MALTDLLNASDHQIASGGLEAVKGGYTQLTLAAGVTLDNTYPGHIGLDPGGAGRIVVLDGIATAINDPAISGLRRTIDNRADAAENLTVNDATGVTIATLNQNDSGDFYHDPDTGWALVRVLTISLT